MGYLEPASSCSFSSFSAVPRSRRSISFPESSKGNGYPSQNHPSTVSYTNVLIDSDVGQINLGWLGACIYDKSSEWNTCTQPAYPLNGECFPTLSGSGIEKLTLAGTQLVTLGTVSRLAQRKFELRGADPSDCQKYKVV